MGIRYSVNETFFDTWSEESAYILGYIYADGSLEDSPAVRGKYLRITSTDPDRLKLFKKLLGSEHTIVKYEYPDARKEKFFIRIGNRYLYDRLRALGLTPRKSFTMKFPAVPPQHLSSFVLGYFDGDGCAFIERKTDGRIKRLMSIFTSGSRNFLSTLHAYLFEHTGIGTSGPVRHGSAKSAYQLRYSTRDTFRLILFLYSNKRNRQLALKRKYAIFSEYLKARDLVFNDLPSLLKQKGPVVK